MVNVEPCFAVIVPAAGVGKRMLADCPKQYLTLNNQTILEHTVNRLLSHKYISTVVLALNDDDDYFQQTSLVDNCNIIRVSGGDERVDSVLNGLHHLDAKIHPWVLVHDAARPCISHEDIDSLIEQCLRKNSGGLLATQVVDTIKQAVMSTLPQGNNTSLTPCDARVQTTIDRNRLWQALTPQMYKTDILTRVIEEALVDKISITDESSAIEYAGMTSLLIEGSRENIKITRPEDLALAAFYLERQAQRALKQNKKENSCV